MRRFKQLTKTDRLRIEAHLRDKKSPKEIAEIIGVHISTIYREKKRGEYTHRNTDWTEEIRYSADLAEAKYREELAAKGPQLKIGKDHKLADYIEKRIADDKLSPAAVLGEIRTNEMEFDTTICVNTLYSYIDKGVFLRVTNKNLPDKSNRKRGYHKVKAAKKPPKGESIEKRPEEIGTRTTFGHWEMDTVVSARPGKSAILVLTERLTRKEITAKLPDKTMESVVKALDSLERDWDTSFPKVFRTITVDNGTEFSDCKGIERSVLSDGSRTKVYYCHPYSSYERGSNENLNKMIRRQLPKGTNFDNVEAEAITATTEWMNNYPRKILNYKTSAVLFSEHIALTLGA